MPGTPRRGTITVVYVVLLVAAAAILAGVVVVAMGGGGELTLFRRDQPGFRFRLRTPEDVAALRLPVGLLGYQEQATGDALRQVARLLAERDAEIADLREEVRVLSQRADDRPGPDAGPGLHLGTATGPGVTAGQPPQQP